VRDAWSGVTRFGDFLTRLEIARDVLADRLARLTEEGILERRAYQERPVRHEYRITEKGLALVPVLVAMIEWGDRYHAPSGPPREVIHAECGGHVTQALTCDDCGIALAPADLSTRRGPGARRPAAA
jgi:DNA-binding HxlR family transcriptional regulator